MAILTFPAVIVSQGGNAPRLVQFSCNDTYAQVIAANYLYNVVHQDGFAFLPSDVVFVSYGSTPTFGIFVPTITSSSITLSEYIGQGNVILPVVSGDFAVFSGTTGAIADSANPATNKGSIHAGLSGTAGSLVSYPATLNKGSLALTAVANTGNTATVISNDAMGQASTVNIPDPGNAIGQLLIGATATPFTTGHLVAASGTAGLVVDAGFAAANVIQTTVSGNTQNIAGNLTVNSNPVVVNKTVTATSAALASAGKVNIFVAPTGTAQIAILDIKVFLSTGLSGNSGNRLLSLADGTLVFNNAGITAALLGTPIFTLWGGTGNPVASSSEATVSTAGANVYLQYSGGSADYNAGSVIISVTYAQVTT